MSDKKIALQDIVIDPTIQVREVEGHTASKYAAAMRAGAVFPPLLVEKGTNRLVCGNHRYYAYKRVLEPSDEVECEYRTFTDEADIIRTAARDNATHGRPLDTWDSKRITLRLQQAGDDLEDIAALLHVPVRKVETWAGQQVIVVGKKGKRKLRRHEPVKHGLEHLAGHEITEEQWQAHAERDRGVPAVNQATTLTRWIDNGWIDAANPRVIHTLEALKESLDRFLDGQKEKTA